MSSMKLYQPGCWGEEDEEKSPNWPTAHVWHDRRVSFYSCKARDIWGFAKRNITQKKTTDKLSFTKTVYNSTQI